jgi:hypothetical protein
MMCIEELICDDNLFGILTLITSATLSALSTRIEGEEGESK